MSLPLRPERIEAHRRRLRANPPPPMTEEQARVLVANFGTIKVTRSTRKIAA